MTPTLQKLKTDFLTYLELDRNRSQRTIINYDHYLSRFLDFARTKSVASPEQISHELISGFRLQLNRAGSLSKRTQDYHIIALRSFLRFLRKSGIQTRPPESVELGRATARSITFLEPTELSRLFTAPAADEDPLCAARDTAILQLLFSTGLRVSELCALNRDQVNLESREVAVTGKGGKTRLVFISDVAAQTLGGYLQLRRDEEPALFVSESFRGRSRLTPRSIERIVKARAAAAGIVKKVTPHVLRHSFATDLLRAGADLRSIQQLLGHASVTTTQIYTHVTDPHLKETHTKYHGKSLKE